MCEHLGISYKTGAATNFNTKTTTAIRDHINTSGHVNNFENFEILSFGKNDFECLVKESILIKKNTPPLNKQVKTFKLSLFWILDTFLLLSCIFRFYVFVQSVCLVYVYHLSSNLLVLRARTSPLAVILFSYLLTPYDLFNLFFTFHLIYLFTEPFNYLYPYLYYLFIFLFNCLYDVICGSYTTFNHFVMLNQFLHPFLTLLSQFVYLPLLNLLLYIDNENCK